MNTLRLYGRSMAILIKSQLQYPASFLMQTLAQLVMEGGELLAVILLIDRFDRLKDGEIIYDGRDLLKIPEEEFHTLRGGKRLSFANIETLCSSEF